MKIYPQTIGLIIVSIPILLGVVWAVIWVVILVLASITYSGYVENVNELAGRYYGLNGDIFNIESDGRFYYEMQYDRFYHNERTFEIYGRMSLQNARKIVDLDWDEKYVVPRGIYDYISIDLPKDIYNNMNLDRRANDNKKTGKGLWFADKEIFLCHAETKHYNVFLFIGTGSGTMLMTIYQYPSGNNPGGYGNLRPPDIFPEVTAADLADLQQLDSKE